MSRRRHASRQELAAEPLWMGESRPFRELRASNVPYISTLFLHLQIGRPSRDSLGTVFLAHYAGAFCSLLDHRWQFPARDKTNARSTPIAFSAAHGAFWDPRHMGDGLLADLGFSSAPLLANEVVLVSEIINIVLHVAYVRVRRLQLAEDAWYRTFEASSQEARGRRAPINQKASLVFTRLPCDSRRTSGTVTMLGNVRAKTATLSSSIVIRGRE
ncbi:hypothetical protein EJ03DRAFT_99954 [Teratosphaeria nubilosa]|uniref:Uncharacterized protein n=1 Tax=Teratosphaeria nubilosa TaxID=161662 RepID=A0A6G1L8K8_9PEZI|nr:hypothetical protein EJ03DRAFT_99954 [Teratosphaeria nubilosa]